MRLEQSFALQRGLISRLGHGGDPAMAPTRPLAHHLERHITSTTPSSTFISFSKSKKVAYRYMLGEPQRIATEQQKNWNGMIVRVPTDEWVVTLAAPGQYRCAIPSMMGVIQQVVLVDAVAFLVANPELGGTQRDNLLSAAREDEEWIIWLDRAPGQSGVNGPNAVLELGATATATTYRLEERLG